MLHNAYQAVRYLFFLWFTVDGPLADVEEIVDSSGNAGRHHIAFISDRNTEWKQVHLRAGGVGPSLAQRGRYHPEISRISNHNILGVDVLFSSAMICIIGEL